MNVFEILFVWNLCAIASFAILYKANVEVNGGPLAPVVYIMLGPVGTIISIVKAVRNGK